MSDLSRATDRLRRVLQLANQEAQRFNHEYIGTEHLLLGLVKDGSGTAALVLKGLDVDLRKIRLEVEKLVQSGPSVIVMGKLPWTPRATSVMDKAREAACDLNANYLGTEHLLMGLLREPEGIAGQVLASLGVTEAAVTEDLKLLLGCNCGEAGCVRHDVTVTVSVTEPELFGVTMTRLPDNMLRIVGTGDPPQAVELAPPPDGPFTREAAEYYAVAAIGTGRFAQVRIMPWEEKKHASKGDDVAKATANVEAWQKAANDWWKQEQRYNVDCKCGTDVAAEIREATAPLRASCDQMGRCRAWDGVPVLLGQGGQQIGHTERPSIEEGGIYADIRLDAVCGTFRTKVSDVKGTP